VICDDKQLVKDVLAHRDKSTAKEYMKLDDSKKTDILTEIKKQGLFHESALNDMNVPLPISILYGVRLSTKAKVNFSTNPYVTVTVVGHNQKPWACKVKDTSDPVWKDEGYIFSVPRTFFTQNNSLEIEFEVRSRRKGIKDSFCGIAKISLRDTDFSTTQRRTLRLRGKKFKDDGEDHGELTVEIDTKWVAMATKTVDQSYINRENPTPSSAPVLSADDTRSADEYKKEPSPDNLNALSTPIFSSEPVAKPIDEENPLNPFNADRGASASRVSSDTNPFGSGTVGSGERPGLVVAKDITVPVSTNPFAKEETNPFANSRPADPRDVTEIRKTIDEADNLFA